MARKPDSGWRDESLNKWHVANGFPCPAAGMALPMIEYDRGQAVGLVNYIRRGDPLPSGSQVAAAYRAFGHAYPGKGSEPLPFLTAVYDSRNWAMQLFPHNDAARSLLGDEGPYVVTEKHFAAILYLMRDRTMPDMFGYGVEWSTAPWLRLEPLGERASLPFPCADMSARRREYEPTVSAPMRVKLPCLDIDLAVVDHEDSLSLVVDYKRFGAACDVAGTNATALASLAGRTGPPVPAFMTRYFGQPGSYGFEAYPLNRAAASLLAYSLGSLDDVDAMARAVAGDLWVRLTEPQWLGVLKAARDL